MVLENGNKKNENYDKNHYIASNTDFEANQVSVIDSGKWTLIFFNIINISENC